VTYENHADKKTSKIPDTMYIKFNLEMWKQF